MLSIVNLTNSRTCIYLHVTTNMHMYMLISCKHVWYVIKVRVLGHGVLVATVGGLDSAVSG